MVNFKLFANVNPLSPNVQILVMDSRSIGSMNVDEVCSIICNQAYELASQGYSVSVHEISDTVIDFTKFV